MIEFESDFAAAILRNTGGGVWVWNSGRPDALHVRFAGDTEEGDLRSRIASEDWQLLRSRLRIALDNGDRLSAIVRCTRTGADAEVLQLVGAVAEGAGPKPKRIMGLCWSMPARSLADDPMRWGALAKLSHELRSPLTAVAQQTHELRDGVGDPVISKALGDIQRNCEFMQRLIENMLDAFRAGERETAPRPERVVTQDFVDEFFPAIRDRARAKGLQAHLSREPGFPDQIWVDPTALRRILQNLLDNAVKFTEEGSISLSLLYLQDAGDARLQFDVADTGPGMTDDDAVRIFEPFEQGEAGHRALGGVGIGLATSRQMAIGLGGTLTVDSEPGSGSRFRLTIPARSSRSEAAEERAVQSKPGSAAGRKILLVDDHALLAKVTGRSLARLGCAVDVAANAEQAVAHLRGRTPDLVILDLDLPDMSGYELCRQLKARAQLARCRFVAYSGSDEPRDREAAAAAGFDRFVVKPCSAEELLGG